MSRKRKSTTLNVIFYALFLIVMAPISPLILIWVVGEKIEAFVEWYGGLVWSPLNNIHNKINPYREKKS